MNQVASSKSANGKRVMMVVDDLALNRAILNEYFKDNYRIEQMENGEYAWNYLQNNHENVAIIMLDLYMPVMDGFQFMKNMRSDDIYKDIPVIITSLAGEQLNQVMQDNNADGILTKPYVKEEAVQVVSDAIEKTTEKSIR